MIEPEMAAVFVGSSLRLAAPLLLLATAPCLLGAANGMSDFDQRLLASHNGERAAI